MTSAPDLSVLDALTQQNQADRQRQLSQLMPLPQPTPPPGMAPAPNTGAPAPGSFEDLQQRAAQAPQQLGQALQNQQQQFGQTQDLLEQAQRQLNDPLTQVQRQLVDQYQQLGMQRHAGVKGLLQNFFSGFGQAMENRVGILTPQQRQNNILAQLVNVSNAQSIEDCGRHRPQICSL
jgi:hypothetical protein